jgi:amino acid permease
MLGLPRAFAESGYLVGSLLLVLSGFGSMLGLHLLAVSQNTVGIQPSSFYTVANAAMPSLTVLIDVAVWVKCFGVGTSYLIVVGDLMPDAMADIGVEVQPYTRDMWVLIGWIVVVPLACLRTLDALKFTSAAALCFVFFILIFVVLFAVDTPGIPHFDPCPVINGTEPECRGSSGYLSTTPIRTLKVFSIFVFAFTCQQNIFAVCSELRNATIARIDAVISASIGVAWVVYMVVAVAGFETYGDAVKSNILVSYPVSVVVSVARIAITLLVVFSYPLQSHPARKCFLTLYIALRHGKQSKVVATVSPSFLRATFLYMYRFFCCCHQSAA